MINFDYLMADVKPFLLLSILHWQMLWPKFTVEYLIANTYGRCYYHINIKNSDPNNSRDQKPNITAPYQQGLS